MKKVPAGTFIVPLLISAILYTLFPGYLEIGGQTQWLLTDDGTGFIVAAIVFFSGTLVNIHSVLRILKRHGVLILVKTIAAIAVSWLYVQLFDYDGVFGISILAVVLTVTSFNPSMYMSLSQDYGDTEDLAAFGLLSIFCLPIYPLIVYGFVGTQSSLDFTVILSTLIPLLLGVILGNLDHDFTELFGSGISLMLPILGWNIGYGMNLINAIQAGIPGIALAILFYIVNSPMFLTDAYLLKNDGITGLNMTAAAGLSISYAPVLAESFPSLEPFVQTASVQVLMAVVITMVMTPLLAKARYNKVYPGGKKKVYTSSKSE